MAESIHGGSKLPEGELAALADARSLEVSAGVVDLSEEAVDNISLRAVHLPWRGVSGST